MNIEIRNLKYLAANSEETYCFHAKVYVDGKCHGEVQNDGQGGPHRYHPHNLESLLAVEAAQLPEKVVNLEGVKEPFHYKPDADSIISKLVEKELDKRYISKLLKRKIIFVCHKTGKLKEVCKMKPTPDGIARFKKERPLDNVLNALPFEEASALYFKHTVV